MLGGYFPVCQGLTARSLYCREPASRRSVSDPGQLMETKLEGFLAVGPSPAAAPAGPRSAQAQCVTRSATLAVTVTVVGPSVPARANVRARAFGHARACLSVHVRTGGIPRRLPLPQANRLGDPNPSGTVGNGL